MEEILELQRAWSGFSSGLQSLWSKKKKRKEVKKEKQGCGGWERRSICSEGHKSERFTVFARPPNSLAPF